MKHSWVKAKANEVRLSLRRAGSFITDIRPGGGPAGLAPPGAEAARETPVPEAGAAVAAAKFPVADTVPEPGSAPDAGAAPPDAATDAAAAGRSFASPGSSRRTSGPARSAT